MTKPTPKRKRRLGKGLESLLARPVAVEPPEKPTKQGLPALKKKRDENLDPPEPSGVDAPSGGDGPQVMKSVGVNSAAANSGNIDSDGARFGGVGSGNIDSDGARFGGVGSGNIDSDGARFGGVDSAQPSMLYLEVSKIAPNPKQPRQVFEEQGLIALADSIKTAGLMQPIVVRQGSGKGVYEIVAGERRWRAAQLAGLMHIPSILQYLDDKTAAEWSLIENLQREDLNPIDRAEAFDRLIVDFGVSHQDIASQLGIDRSSVSNFIRLNDLASSIKDAVRDGRLSMGHAKVLLSISDETSSNALAKRCATEQWSVRELERQVKRLSSKISTSSPSEQDPRTMFMENLSSQLGDHLGTQVKIALGAKKGSGSLVISFYSNDQFEGILDRLHFKPSS